ncbi:ABC transporter substrate-binding protein [Spiractinospora alimapuensis]|uniref:ABC transporter substrate-binding protein n=1 Tax=Spiractinospora alimapuensis TaxID=2820884 RepID=UPI001F319C2F|nr:ABC transporter substrate-binding protein [Spiractinospora alimapuensis]QVQ53735.1 ABC transporter substrate-binding protein [Spiractinospora alimapuensis]
MSKTRISRMAVPVGAALALTAAGCAGSAVDSGGDDEGPIRIGAVLDITGAGAQLAAPQKNALEMLVDQLNEDGGVDGREVEVIIRDNQSEEDVAAREMNSLVNEENVDIVFGASRTGPSLAMREIAEENEIPMISLAANIAIIDDAEWIFKTAQNDSIVLERMLDYVEGQGWETAGLMRDSSGFGEGVEETIEELGAERGVELIGTERFTPDATDFTAQTVNIRDLDADVNFIWGIPPSASLAQVAYDDLDIETPLVQSHGIGEDEFLETAGAAANGIVFPIGRILVADQLPDDDPQAEVIQSFHADYVEEFGSNPSTFAGHAWDAFHLSVDAFEEVGTDPHEVRDYLESVEGFVGITGTFNMSPEDHSGLGTDALVYVTVEDEEFVLMDEQD